MNLQGWREAQCSASSPEDWFQADQIAARIFKNNKLPRELISFALKLGLERLNGSVDAPIEDGDPSDTWPLYLMQATWRALNEPVRYEDAFFSLPVIGHSIDPHGRVLAVTQRWCDLLGMSPDQARGRQAIDLMTPESRRAATEIYMPKFWQTGCISQAHCDFVHSSGQTLPVSLSAVVEYDGFGQPVRTMSILSRRESNT